MKALEAGAVNKKLLKSSQRKGSGPEIDLKNNPRLGKKQGRFQRKKEETESSSSGSDTTSSSSSDSSDSDSSSSSIEVSRSPPRRGKRSSFRYQKEEVEKDSHSPRKKSVCATSTPKREGPMG